MIKRKFSYNHAIKILLKAKESYSDLTDFILYYEDKMSKEDYEDLLFEFAGYYDKRKVKHEI